MPNAALKACSYPGCPALVIAGRCDKHRVAEFNYRDPERQRLYDRRWRRRRAIQLENHPWCENCLEQGIYTQATEVHHKNRHEGDLKTFLMSPLQSLCKPCHTRETIKEMHG